jgi:hypothetical protein
MGQVKEIWVLWCRWQSIYIYYSKLLFQGSLGDRSILSLGFLRWGMSRKFGSCGVGDILFISTTLSYYFKEHLGPSGDH